MRFRDDISRASILCSIFAVILLIVGCGEQSTPQTSANDHHHNGDATVVHTHDDPNTTCFICDPAKRDKGRLWCKGHGRYEDRCWLCHPELEDKDRLYCKEHFLYEDECFLCHPKLEQKSDAATDPVGDADGTSDRSASTLFCTEHGVPEIECGICQPDLASTLKPGGNLKIRFPSPEAAGKVGITTEQPQPSSGAPTVRVFCEVQYNMNTMAKVTPFAPGVIRNIHVDVGDRVTAGDVLVELHSAEVAAVKSSYLAAVVELDIQRQSFDREKRLVEQNIGAQKNLLEAEAAHRTSQFNVNKLRQKLANLGFQDEEIAAIDHEQDTSARLVIRAPFDGTLVDRAAVIGEAVTVGDPLFTLADLSTRWLILSIPSSQIGQVGVGQIVNATFGELPGVTITGKIVWVDSSVDSRSRMVHARVLVSDNAEMVKVGLFGEADIVIGNERPAVLIPHQSVQRHEQADFVFVQTEPDLFALRRVALGSMTGDRVEVLAGLEPSDAVVANGSFIVMSEFLKSRLGAGCTDH